MAQPRGTADGEAEGRTAVQRFSYRLFIGYVSLNALLVLVAYYLLPLPWPVREVLAIVDTLNAIILLVDFLAQLITSDNKVRYVVFSGGWLDLLGSLPLHPLLRLLRIGRGMRSWRRLARTTPVEIRLAARRRLAESGLFMVATLVLLVVTAGSIALAAIEPRAAGATIRTGGDAVWFVLTTVATVGYGDTYPVTDAGRTVAVLLMVVGISAFSVLTSYIASAFMSRRRTERDAGIPEVDRSPASSHRFEGEDVTARAGQHHAMVGLGVIPREDATDPSNATDSNGKPTSGACA